jgi:UDP-N-acetylmuramoylalanine--D-glutamate ligase
LRHFFVDSMEEAVRLAKQHTIPGMACLLSPASPSFGLFRDYRERGERFKQLVQASEPRPCEPRA